MNKKFPLQICQDEEITKKSNNINVFNIIVDELQLNADCLEDSIKAGSWQSCTDSAFSIIKFTDEYKDVVTMNKIVDDKEWKRIKLEQENYLFSS